MSIIYYLISGLALLFIFYTGINLLLTIKFVNRLSQSMKDKYFSLIKTSKIIFMISSICFLGNFFAKVYLLKIMALAISMFFNSYIVSELEILKEYI